MAIEARVVTDPACPWSWGTEPKLRRLAWELDEGLDLRFVMGGLRRTIGEPERAMFIEEWPEVAAESGMPFDPTVWSSGGITSTYPACHAVVAAAEQGPAAAGRCLRRLREGIFCERRQLDHPDALVAAAAAAGLDRDRFAIDLSSNAIVEGFGAHLEEARDIPEDARRQGAVGGADSVERLTFPSVLFVDAAGKRHGVYGWQPYERYVEAAQAAGAKLGEASRPAVLEVIDRFGRCATREIEELTGRPRVVVEAELWTLAREWRLAPLPTLTGTLWERA